MSDITFCDTDVKEIESRIIGGYEEAAKVKLYPADPIRIFLQGLAYVIAQSRVVINETGKQNLLRYAMGDKLDALGELTGTMRIPESRASVTVQFTRAEGSTSAVFIRKGTRVTSDGKLYFQTITDAVILEGAPSVTAKCVAMTVGVIGNGYAIGSINKIVDPVSYLSRVTNTTESAGGRNTETDDALRERIYIAPESFSTAGPILAYEYHAKSADAGVIDVAILSPTPGKVEIYPLMTGGAIPEQEVLDRVKAAVTDDKVRPLTDYVEVKAPVEVGYEVTFSYYLYENSGVTDTAVKDAVGRYIMWQKGKLGRDINPDKLRSELITAGVKRIEMTAPIFKIVSANEVAHCEDTLITFGGVEDE